MHIIKEHFNWKHQILVFVLTVAMTVGGFFLLDFVSTDTNFVSAACITTVFYAPGGHAGFMGPSGAGLGYQRIEGSDGVITTNVNRGFVSFDTQTLTDSDTIQSAFIRWKKLSTGNGNFYYINDTPFNINLGADAYNKNVVLIGSTSGTTDNIVDMTVHTVSVSTTQRSQYSIRDTSGYVRYYSSSPLPELHVTHCSALPPTVNTLVQQNVTTNSARIRGEANPNGLSATGWLRYSTVNPGSCNDSFGTRTPASGGTALGAGSGLVGYNRDIVSLAPSTTYYYCAIASNSSGTSVGSIRSFTTSSLPLPVVTTNIASNISGTGATLNGSVNPNGLSATGWFRYSTTSPGSCNDTFGTRIPSSGGAALGSGTSVISYSNSLTGLATGTTYYFCAIASNSSGTGFGSIVSFTTPSFTVSGFVYEDINGNGVKDVGESGSIFAGSTIKIDYQTGGTVATVIADSSGFFVFAGLSSGNYVLVLSPVPAGYQANSNNIPFSL